MDFASPVLELVTCLWGCFSSQIKHVGDLEGNTSSLRSATEELRDLSEDVKKRIELAQEQQVVRTRKQAEGWLRTAELLEKEASQLLQRSEEEVQRKCFWGRCPRNCGSSYRVHGKVEKMLIKVKEERSKGCFTVVADELPYVLVEERPLENTVGLDLIFQKAWMCIHEENLRILGLYGLGGVGKTTLLTKINNEFVSQIHDFKLVIWVGVAKQARIEDVQEVIRNRLNLKDMSWHRKCADEKATTIYRFLRGKKFVLLLDDVWKPLNLLKVGIPLNEGMNKFKIIFTTRSQEVCGQMEAQARIKVTCLADCEAKTLFSAKVGEETLKSHPEIQELADIVCRECDGLPLAVITVGRAMSGKKDPREWRRAIEILKESPSRFSGMRDHVFNVLRFSYDNLDDETAKQCFLYCSIFPEDCDIPKQNLIEHWIAEGYIDELNDINEARNQGLDIILKLKNACLLETSKSEDCVKMHDVIRDMAMWITCGDRRKGNKIVVEQHTKTLDATRTAKWNESERVSAFGATTISSSPNCRYLSTLVIRDCNIVRFPSMFFQHMPSLRVLDLGNNEKLVELPMEISMLDTLQYLDLSSTKIEKIPMEFKNLTDLRHLLLDFTKDLSLIPQEVVRRFSHLRVLSINYACSDDYLDDIIENNVLSGGKEALLLELEHSETLQDLCLTLTTLSALTRLFGFERFRRSIRQLSLKRCKSMTEIIIPFDLVEQMVNLERLDIRNCRDLKLMTIQCSSNSAYGYGFNNLRSVTISDCQMVEMVWLMYAPALESLHLQGCKLLEKVLCETPSLLEFEKHQKVFSRLKTITLFDLPELTSLYPRTLPFPSLEKLRVTLCPSLRTLPFSLTTAPYKLTEIVGWPTWWEQLEWEDDMAEPFFRAHFRPSN